MLIKLKKYASEHRYAGFIFLFMFVYNFIVNQFSLPEMDEITYTYHIVDFNIGFCTKLLPGALYNAIFPTTEFNVVNLYFFILYHTFLIIVAFILETFLKKFNGIDRIRAFISVMFFITGPATFSIHALRLGMLDTYWLFFAVIFIMIIRNKYLRWFAPIFFVLSIFIHVSAMISFIPFFALILLFEATQNKDSQKAYLSIFGISVIFAVITFIYFTLFESSNLQLNLDEFRSLVSSKNESELVDYTTYYDYALYRISYVNGLPIENIPGIFNSVLLQIKETFSAYSVISKVYYFETVYEIALTFPVITFSYLCLAKFLKTETSNKIRCFTYFCSLMLLPITFFVGSMCSPDITRWFGHGFFLLFSFVLYCCYRSEGHYPELLYKNKSLSLWVLVVIYFLLYMSFVVDPYY